ncbi:MAG: hypothetical protein MUO72_15435 [Bacteroidales bacterium]|nr:hypothetical protein [Bacteroidales bacterium]
MKKLIFILTGLIVMSIVSAQSLEDIVNKYTVANKLDKMSGIKTLKLTGKMSMMGMEMPMEIWMKNPNKIKSVTNISGQEMIQAFDGEKGYSVNPMTGSSEPVEMTPDQVQQVTRSNMFQNEVMGYLKDGKLVLEGEESVNGKPAFKLKATIQEGIVTNIFIDKATFLLVKSVVNTTQQGMPITVESYPSEYTETNGVMLPMKTTTSTSGMEFVMTFTKVEVDIPMEDSIFTLK